MSDDTVLFIAQFAGGLAVLGMFAVIADVVVPWVQRRRRRRTVRRLMRLTQPRSGVGLRTRLLRGWPIEKAMTTGATR